MEYTDYNATQMSDLLGLAYQDYNYLMALSGLLIGSILIKFVIERV